MDIKVSQKLKLLLKRHLENKLLILVSMLRAMTFINIALVLCQVIIAQMQAIN